MRQTMDIDHGHRNRKDHPLKIGDTVAFHHHVGRKRTMKLGKLEEINDDRATVMVTHPIVQSIVVNTSWLHFIVRNGSGGFKV